MKEMVDGVLHFPSELQNPDLHSPEQSHDSPLFRLRQESHLFGFCLQHSYVTGTWVKLTHLVQVSHFFIVIGVHSLLVQVSQV